MNNETICICGGGNLGTVLAGVASSKGYKVNLLTGSPEKWDKTIHITLCDNKNNEGQLDHISKDPEEVIPQSNIILFCLPGTAIEKYLNLIKPYISPGQIIGSVFCSSGFFPMAENIFGNKQPLFGLQRVPFICRINNYGHSATILGQKESVKVAYLNIKHETKLTKLLENIFLTKVIKLSSPWAVTLTNSNPLLHTARLYTLFRDYENGKVYPNNPLFYGEWNLESSELYIKMDGEFQKLISLLNIPSEEIPTVLEYYESKDAKSLTKKISTIESWHNLPSPMIKTPKGWIPDFNSRYFTEDFPLGLKLIKELAAKENIPTPLIDKVYEWGMHRINASNKP